MCNAEIPRNCAGFRTASRQELFGTRNSLCAFMTSTVEAVLVEMASAEMVVVAQIKAGAEQMMNIAGIVAVGIVEKASAEMADVARIMAGVAQILNTVRRDKPRLFLQMCMIAVSRRIHAEMQ